ncbi:MAG: hypothetical protein KGM44_08325 [bacterium]|nr:hypothetical protein [bacterium]
MPELDACAAEIPDGAATLFLQVARTLGAGDDGRLIDGVIAGSRRLLADAPGLLGWFQLRLPEISIVGMWFAGTEAPFHVRESEPHRRWSAWARARGDALGVFNVRLAVEQGRVPRPSETFEVLLAMGLLL